MFCNQWYLILKNISNFIGVNKTINGCLIWLNNDHMMHMVTVELKLTDFGLQLLI